MSGDEDEKRGQKGIQSLFIFVAAVAFVVAPFMKYADLATTVSAAGLGGLGVQILTVARSGLFKFFGVVLMMLGLIVGSLLLSEGVGEHYANQRRCLDIEVDMMSADPKVENDADRFQALGCIPQPRKAAEAARKKGGPPKRPIPLKAA